MGYHKRKIRKGVFGEISKIQEELDELVDANEQGVKIMELVEIADLYGAIQGYLKEHHPGVSMKDIKKMSKRTKSAFEDGTRKSSETQDKPKIWDLKIGPEVRFYDDDDTQ